METFSSILRLVWLMNVPRLATAEHVAAGLHAFWLQFSNIHAVAHAINELTCCKQKQAWMQTAQA